MGNLLIRVLAVFKMQQQRSFGMGMVSYTPLEASSDSALVNHGMDCDLGLPIEVRTAAGAAGTRRGIHMRKQFI